MPVGEFPVTVTVHVVEEPRTTRDGMQFRETVVTGTETTLPNCALGMIPLGG